MSVVGTPQFTLSMKISKGTVLPDAHLKTPYPGSPRGELFG